VFAFVEKLAVVFEQNEKPFFPFINLTVAVELMPDLEGLMA